MNITGKRYSTLISLLQNLNKLLKIQVNSEVGKSGRLITLKWQFKSAFRYHYTKDF